MRVLLLFQFGFLLFLFLFWLLWPKLPELCWIVVVKVGTLVLFLTLGEMLQFFTIEDNVCCGFVIYCFCYVELCSFYSCFLEGFFCFYHKWMLNFVKGFLWIYWDNHMILSFNLLMWCITLIDFWILKNPCIPGIKPTWSWYMIFLICCWILFARICWGFLHLCSSVILTCSFLVWHLCLVLVLGGWWPQRMSLGVYLPLQFSGRVWVGVLLEIFCRIQLWSRLDLGFCLLEDFFIIVWISVLVMKSVKIFYFILVQFWKVILF